MGTPRLLLTNWNCPGEQPNEKQMHPTQPPPTHQPNEENVPHVVCNTFSSHQCCGKCFTVVDYVSCCKLKQRINCSEVVDFGQWYQVRDECVKLSDTEKDEYISGYETANCL